MADNSSIIEYPLGKINDRKTYKKIYDNIENKITYEEVGYLTTSISEDSIKALFLDGIEFIGIVNNEKSGLLTNGCGPKNEQGVPVIYVQNVEEPIHLSKGNLVI
jgi:hypothetical protein